MQQATQLNERQLNELQARHMSRLNELETRHLSRLNQLEASRLQRAKRAPAHERLDEIERLQEAAQGAAGDY